MGSPATLPTGADGQEGPPSTKFYELRDNLRIEVAAVEVLATGDCVLGAMGGVSDRAEDDVNLVHELGAAKRKVLAGASVEYDGRPSGSVVLGGSSATDRSYGRCGRARQGAEAGWPAGTADPHVGVRFVLDPASS
jgi:hypothetical protein